MFGILPTIDYLNNYIFFNHIGIYVLSGAFFSVVTELPKPLKFLLQAPFPNPSSAPVIATAWECTW
ncbi:hypothetical protein CAL7102_00022 [Dulcicalothrix desertica PCC 7102]|nr:hypothetical protein CAL7102_00022 [Dulcicalothrix desertica PCC 7102]